MAFPPLAGCVSQLEEQELGRDCFLCNWEEQPGWVQHGAGSEGSWARSLADHEFASLRPDASVMVSGSLCWYAAGPQDVAARVNPGILDHCLKYCIDFAAPSSVPKVSPGYYSFQASVV